MSRKMRLRLAIYCQIRALHAQLKATWRRPKVHGKMSPDPTLKPMLTRRILLCADNSVVN